MTFAEYSKKALRTLKPGLTQDELLNNAILGCLGELGEVSDLVKKHKFHGHILVIEEVIKEIGDLLWYVNLLAEVMDYSLEEIAALNIAKLEKRYPDKFTSEASINRLE